MKNLIKFLNINKKYQLVILGEGDEETKLKKFVKNTIFKIRKVYGQSR